jgi:hypothetical protein
MVADHQGGGHQGRVSAVQEFGKFFPQVRAQRAMLHRNEGGEMLGRLEFIIINFE